MLGGLFGYGLGREAGEREAPGYDGNNWDNNGNNNWDSGSSGSWDNSGSNDFGSGSSDWGSGDDNGGTSW